MVNKEKEPFSRDTFFDEVRKIIILIINRSIDSKFVFLQF